MHKHLIKDINNYDRPRERLIKYGSSHLTSSELLSIVLRSGTNSVSALDLANKLLKTFNNLEGICKQPYINLKNIKGIGIAKACALLGSFELGARVYNYNNNSSKSGITINSPKQVFEFSRNTFFNKEQEYLYLIALDSRNKILAFELISVGTVNETLIHPREVYKKAILHNSVSIILVHNHPSGFVTPSTSDIEITNRIVKSGEILEFLCLIM